MAAQVLMPQEKRDAFDTLAQALGVAANAYGIYANRERLNMEQAKFEKENANEGVLTPEKHAALLKQGFKEVPTGSKDSAVFKTPDGASTMAFAIPAEVPKPVDTEKRKETEFKQENQLRDEYQKLSNINSAKLGYYKNIEDVATSGRKTAASDMSIVYNYMKMLDPTSVVREGEYATAEATKGIPDYISVAYNKAVSGERLSPEQVSNFATEARNLAAVSLRAQGEVDSQYENLAKQYGLSASKIIDPKYKRELIAIEKKLKSSISKAPAMNLGPILENTANAQAPFNPLEYLQSK